MSKLITAIGYNVCINIIGFEEQRPYEYDILTYIEKNSEDASCIAETRVTLAKTGQTDVNNGHHQKQTYIFCSMDSSKFMLNRSLLIIYKSIESEVDFRLRCRLFDFMLLNFS